MVWSVSMYLPGRCCILVGMHTGERWWLGHRPGLDGLRGVAILLVLFAHSHVATSNAGPVGVSVFFALSGFLITSLLLEERESTGSVSLFRFFGRRGRRLLPALAVYLLAWSGFAAVGIGPCPFDLRAVLGSVFYFTNWLMALHHAIPHPFSITWSLSIEEQFYLLWPLTFLAARRWPRLPVTAAGVGVLVAIALRAGAWDGSQGVASSIYYSSPTRMDNLLIGCLLAMAVKRWGVTRAGCQLVAALGLVGLTALAVTGNQTLLTLAGPPLVAVCTCALIVAVLAGRLRVLEHPVLRWFGKRSYALYLWHYPLMVLAWKDNQLLPMPVCIALALAAAELSWWVVERPFQRRSTDQVLAQIFTPATPDELGVSPDGAGFGVDPVAVPVADSRVLVPRIGKTIPVAIARHTTEPTAASVNIPIQ